MPTSSQAMIVITDEGDDPRVPRRHFPKDSSTLPVMNIGNSENQRKASLPILKNATNYAGFQTVVNAKGYNGFISYDPTTNTLQWLTPTTERNKSRVRFSEHVEHTFCMNRQQHQSIQNTHDALRPTREEQEKRLIQLENIGVRKRRIDNLHKTKGTHSLTALPKDAMFMPSPPGEKPRLLTPIQTYGDVSIATNRLAQPVKPKSFLDEIKEAVSYEKRVFPSMYMRESLPAPCPNTVCFSLRYNENYTHKDIIDLIKDRTGFRVKTIQFDPVDVRAGSYGVPSRWIVKFADAYETHLVVQNGLEINGEKIVVRLLDDVYKMEFQAFQLKLEEEKRQKQREAMVRVQRKSKRSNTKTRQNGQARQCL